MADLCRAWHKVGLGSVSRNPGLELKVRFVEVGRLEFSFSGGRRPLGL